VISAGFGYTAPNWVGAAFAVAALGLAVLSSALERRTARAAEAARAAEESDRMAGSSLFA
jgi:DHA1 family inner membrane transport protein